MLFVPITDVRPGMVVAKAVGTALNRPHLVERGLRLKQKTIARLAQLGIDSIWIECDGSGDVAEKINDKVIEKRQELTQLLAASVEALSRRTDSVIECSQLDAKVGELLSEIMDDPTHEALFTAISGACPAMVQHLTNCCYVSLMLGMHLSGYVRSQRRRLPKGLEEDLRELGMGAFLHDIGKVRLADRVQKIHALHRENSDTEYRAHVEIGCEMVRGQLAPIATYMVAHHHQRFDGSGFPVTKPHDRNRETRALAGERIHVFARVLAVADAFDHLVGLRPAANSTILALHLLQQPRFAGWFDPIIVAALNRLVPPFMIGSIVKLTDERQAVVLHNHSEAPCHPTVRIIEGIPGSPDAKVLPEDVELRNLPDLSVASVGGADVRPYFFDPPNIPESVLAYWGLRTKTVGASAIDIEKLTKQEAVSDQA